MATFTDNHQQVRNEFRSLRKFYDEIKDERLQEWYNDYMHLPTTGGESFPMLYKRVAAFLDDLKQAAVFAHGGVLISAGLYAGLFDERQAWDHLTPFGGLQRIDI